VSHKLISLTLIVTYAEDIQFKQKNYTLNFTNLLS